MIPDHVLTAFGSDSSVPPVSAGPAWDHGWVVGPLVYSEATDTAHWSASVRTKLTVAGVRVARPARSSDGRVVVGGWRASGHIAGELSLRIDETVAAALRLADALAEVDGPVDLRRTDLFAEAEREAWARCDEEFGVIDAPLQVGHADMLATTIYSGSAAPAVTDLVPFAQPRPHAMTAAQAIADALIIGAEGGVDTGVIERFAHLPDLEDLILRGLTYREIVADRHPDENSLTCSNIAAVRAALMSRRSATI
ncbi:hypothetical protein [Corynebacterium doosanense]|uniref:TIGR02569 family protein n=1 Tax=Corynebacterium doosanense CAU 212 = DSM 45436 TaxID=558173 RepID=A0A097IEB1_9CORY|nr:hypothetical protein [Corynebacterium doosanense]AIT60467.1 hypothetical protein CDOO_03760 [Corynebacterium doosanense CAU 212 = DSM 45436]